MGYKFNPITGQLDLVGGSGGGGTDANAFQIVQPDAGTSPTATSVSDTLTLTSSDGSVTITGTAASRTIAMTGAGRNQPSGTILSPTAITAIGGVTPVSGKPVQSIRLQGSGGAVTVTANPAIVAGTIDGQLLTLIGASSTNTVTINDGNGVVQNGPVVLKKYSCISYEWVAGDLNWVERARNDI